MSKTMFTLFGAALMVASTIQAAAVTQHHYHRHQLREAYRPAASAPFRDSNNATAAPDSYAAPPSYYSGGYSAPAGQ